MSYLYRIMAITPFSSVPSSPASCDHHRRRASTPTGALKCQRKTERGRERRGKGDYKIKKRIRDKWKAIQTKERHGLGMAEKREQEEEEEVANKFELSLSLASFCLLLATTTDWTQKERERARHKENKRWRRRVRAPWGHKVRVVPRSSSLLFSRVIQ